MKLTVNVNLDDVLVDYPAIVGPRAGEPDDGASWVVYLPGSTPCICESFASAATLMRKELARRARKERGR